MLGEDIDGEGEDSQRYSKTARLLAYHAKLKDLTNASNEHADRCFGTYLYPHRLFGQPDYDDPVSATKIVATASVQERQNLPPETAGFSRASRSSLAITISSRAVPHAVTLTGNKSARKGSSKKASRQTSISLCANLR